MSDSPSCFVNPEMHQKVRDGMLQIVADSTGIKGTELFTEITIRLVNSDSPVYIEGDKGLKPDCQLTDAIHEVLEDLLRSGDVIELEYTINVTDYRVRSMFFPKGTTFAY